MTILSLLLEKHSTIPVTSIGKELPVDWALMNDETLAHLIWHGMKQKANDPNGAKDLTDSEKEGNSLKVIDSLQKNEVRMTSGRIADPIEAETMRLAVAAVANAILTKGGKLKDYKLAALREKASKHLDKFRAQAEANVAKAAANATELEIEL